jgi:hypothetical protein
MFIEQYYINKKVCDDLVRFFKNTNQKEPGGFSTLKGLKVNPKFKKSIETSFNPESKITEFTNYTKELKKCFSKYRKKWKECDNVCKYGLIEGVNLQYYPPKGGYYVWHTERCSKYLPNCNRHLVFMTYLNDVTDGGETEWKYQKLKIQPKKGLTVIWPTDWTHTHRGIPSKTQDKYIITGWLNFI